MSKQQRKATPDGSGNPFTWFREDRPLGDNPWPPNTSLWETFEECTAQTKGQLDSLWKEYQQQHDPAKPVSKILKLKLDARLRRLDIIASQMLMACPPADEALSLSYENWLEGLMGQERGEVLGLINKGAPGGAFSKIVLSDFDGQFTQVLIDRHLGYKKALHTERGRILRERRLDQKSSSTNGKKRANGDAKDVATATLDHDRRVAKVENNYSPRGHGGKPAYNTFFGEIASAQQFSAWKKGDRRHAGVAWSLLNDAADKLS